MSENPCPRILLALTPLLEREIEAELFGAGASVEIVASAAEADELGELLATHPADALLLSADLSGLTSAHCAQANAAGLRVIGLALDQLGREALTTLGVADALTLPLENGALAAAARGPAAIPARRPARRARERARSSGGSVVAVIGAKGAPGASECAASLAALASRLWETVLVEVDALGPGLDVRLGADATQGSLAGLARAVEGEQSNVGELLERWLIERAGWPPVLLGAPDPPRDLAHPGAAAQTIRAVAATRPLVVCDIGFLIAADDPAGSPSAARIHREALTVADAIVVVLGARDVQLRDGLAQVAELTDGLDTGPERLRVVVNGLGAPGAGSRLEIEAALLPRLAEHNLSVDGWIPWEKRALALARRRGLPLASARPRGPYRRALGRLLGELFVPASPVTRARRQRLTPAPSVEHRTEEVALPWQR